MAMNESSVKREEDTLRIIGKYEVLGVLGRGSMGVVYKARDPEIGREVAIKTLRKIPSTRLSDADAALNRFRTEARSAGNLRHPNIITVFEAGRDNDTPYLVMDYVKGESLDVLIAKHGPLEPGLVMYYLAQVAAALDYAHSKGVIHRDIKPSNILVDESSHVFVLDFGVATINKSFIDVDKSPNEVNVIGTPGYMSPEQILNHPLDHRTDLFSLAVVAFECLTGKRPFPGETFTSVIGNILNSKPLALTMLVPELPLALEAELERGLARKAADRFPAAHLMVEHFCKALGVDPLTLRPLSPVVRNRRKSSAWKAFRAPFGKASRGASPAAGAGKMTAAEREALSPWNIGLRQVNIDDRPARERNYPPGSAAAIFGGAEVLSGETLMSGGWPLLRLMTLLFAGICIALGLSLFWLIFDSPSSKRGGAPEAFQQSAEVPFAVLLAPVDESPLSLPAVAPVPSGKSVHEMSDREVLGVIVGEKVSEEMILNAIREGQARAPVGLVEALTVPLQNDSYVVRVEAIKVLASIGDRRIVPYLVPRLNDHDPIVRGHAARALGFLADRRALGYLNARYLREDVPEVRKALKHAIEKINGFPMK